MTIFTKNSLLRPLPDWISVAKNILIFGVGIEGRSTIDFFRKKLPKTKIFTLDESRGMSADFLAPEFVPWENFDAIFVSPGVSRAKIPPKFQSRATSQTEIFFESARNFRQKIIGISGTKGKSTTAKFTAELLQNLGFRAKISGNFGVPFFEIWDDFFDEKIDALVVELSSFQLENLRISPPIAIFLNFFPDHLDRHGTSDAYFAAKKNLWKFQLPGDVLLSTTAISGVSRAKIPPKFPKKLFPKNSIFRADHFLQNFAVATTAVRIFIEKIDENSDQKNCSKLEFFDSAIQKTAKNFRGLPHRLQFFAEKNGIRFFDDSISTNPDSTAVAVDFFAQNLGSIILGGQDRGQNFRQLIRKLENLDAKIIAFESEVFSRIAGEISNSKNFHPAKNLAEAAKIALKITSARKICLFSTAAPSLGIWKNFAEQGMAWQAEIVKNPKNPH